MYVENVLNLGDEMEKYKDKNWLYKKYVEEKNGSNTIAKICGVSKTTILRWLKKFDIKRRNTQNNNSNKIYRNEDWLYSKYIEDRLSATEIARIVGVDKNTIFKWIRKYNIERKDDNEDWLYNKYVNEKLSTEQIAEICNCSRQTISRRLTKFGIDIREPYEYFSNSNGEYQNREWLYDQYVNKEKSACQIANEIGCNYQTIVNWLRKFDINVRDRKTSVIMTYDRINGSKLYTDKKWLSDRYEKDFMTTTEIANLVGVEQGVISYWMKRLGIKAFDRQKIARQLPPDFCYCYYCNTVKHESEFIPSNRHICIRCKTKYNSKRSKGLNSIELNEWFEGSEGHHVTNDYIIYIPKEIHRQCAYPDREIHRALVLQELIKRRYIDEIKLIEKVLPDDYDFVSLLQNK